MRAWVVRAWVVARTAGEDGGKGRTRWLTPSTLHTHPPPSHTPTRRLDFGSKPIERQLILSAQFLHNELPVRLAHRVAELENLPYGLSAKPHVLKASGGWVERRGGVRAGVGGGGWVGGCVRACMSVRRRTHPRTRALLPPPTPSLPSAGA